MVKARINQSAASPRLFEHAWTWAAGDVIGWSSYFWVCTREEGIQRSGPAVTNRGRAPGPQPGVRCRKRAMEWMLQGFDFVSCFCSLFLKERRQDLAHVEKCMLNSHFLCILVSGKSVHVHYITRVTVPVFWGGKLIYTQMVYGTIVVIFTERLSRAVGLISWDNVAAPYCCIRV